MQLKAVLQTSRPSFLILTPACIFLGVSTAYFSSPGSIDTLQITIILIAALSAHISVNTLNEYYDFKSGLDFNTQRTAFSGGSGTLPQYPELARIVFSVALISFIITIAAGLYLIFNNGWRLLPIGITGLIIIATYTQWLNRLPLLCLISPGLGFGTLMVFGTYVALSVEYSPFAFAISMVPFFLVNNLLLLNQYPDIQADSNIGRKTFPVVYGIKNSNRVYALFILLAYLPVFFFIFTGKIPLSGLAVIIPLIFSFISLTGAIRYKNKISTHTLYLATNVLAALLTPLLLGLSLIYNH